MPNSEKPYDELTPEEKRQRVETILIEEVYPMLEADQGGMDLLEVDGFTVRVRYLGACDGCAVAYSGTGEYIEYLLKTQIDPQIRVVIEEI